MNNNTTNGTFKEYNEDDILSAFCDWLLDLNYQLDRKGWKHDGDRHTARLINKAHDKGGASSASATLYTDKPANGGAEEERNPRGVRDGASGRLAGSGCWPIRHR